jgi:hypothetical protein
MPQMECQSVPSLSAPVSVTGAAVDEAECRGGKRLSR